MFKQPCYIKNNNSYLRNKLKELGYKCNNGKWMGTYLATFKRDEEHDLFYCGAPEYDLINNPSLNVSIDCGDNEELFLAIAALRDDTDKYQWFIYDSTDCVIENLWFICTEDKIEDMLLYDSNFLNTHKATLEEITEHFKQKDNNNDNARI